MACSCDSCSSPRIIKTRTAMFWRWLAESRGETADRVIAAPVRAVVVSIPSGLADHGKPIETSEALRGAGKDEAKQELLDRRRAEFLGLLG